MPNHSVDAAIHDVVGIHVLMPGFHVTVLAEQKERRKDKQHCKNENANSQIG